MRFKLLIPVLFLICLFWLKPLQAAEHAVVLLYHHVGEDTPAITSVTPDRFAEHLNYLHKHGFHILPLDELTRKLANRQPLPEKSIAITFDDGYRSVLEHAVPLLKKRNWPFAVFVNPQAIDHRFGAYMNWDELRQVKRAGGAIVNHTMRHDHLVRHLFGESDSAWRERVKADISKAQQRIETETGAAPRLFAYPYGEFDPALKKLLQDMGYTAFAQQSGAVGYLSDPQALPRFPVMGTYAVKELFQQRVNSRPLPLTVLTGDENVLPADQRRPVLALQLGNGDFDKHALNCYLAGKPMHINWLDREKDIFEIQADQPLAAGRSKYTCTVQAKDNHHSYYWYSHLWMLPYSDGSWPKE
ncbi:biofilm PGA synthesis lipoprotein PgaB [Mariprofundus micogutta]|uniref:Biofilm PGA synthesis lipoprotein PgaB n=1 Tax=Mariprofundus micogutta TaxID=1921010 RepID=A0A1L8CKB5_9PROT|nr:polysaccharide deacetylase family protein [Mariprofundus micogutta]GAV19341.1 biofilm PGA synthesis lipoprotein PgaB [Mariprofundus micogutta]